ncbi:hypothetical protein K1719_040301 [Acacia pycnantha]|nr:hypothetical protein K1719_040301 [Acacia pycnantha]
MAPPSLSKSSPNFTTHVNGFNPSPFRIKGSNLLVNDHVVLSDVPENITATPCSYTSTTESLPTTGCFIGFDAAEASSRHVVPIGKLKNIRFMSIFRFKVWWTTHWIGSNGRELETETQIIILDKSDSGRPYVLILPILEGQFRASIQPGQNDNIDVCVESGSSQVKGTSYRSVVYLHAGEDPFSLVKEAMKIVRAHLGTFNLLDEKTPPGIVDKFGWCTWDAFYLTVHPQGIWDGVKGLADGGCPPGLVLIDDGWQSICNDRDPITKEGINHTVAGEQMPCRLIKYEENYKFRDYVNPKRSGSSGEKGLGAFVKDLKDEFKTVDYVYVWHALCGYWGGIRPNVPGLPECVVEKPKLSPGLETTMEDLAVDKIVNNGVGLVPPHMVDQMYEGLHSTLEASGIDGVKVDVIHVSV